MIAPGSRGMGLVPQNPDPRDLQMLDAFPRLATATYPPTLSLVRYVNRVRDQGQVPNCQSNAAAAIIEVQRKRQLLKLMDLGTIWLYWNARLEDGSLPTNAGATNRGVLKGAYKFGVLANKDWPDGQDFVQLDPTTWWFEQRFQSTPHMLNGLYRIDNDPVFVAHHHPIHTYRVVNADVASVRGSIANGFGVLTGIALANSWYATNSTTGEIPMPLPTDTAIGYHSVALLGYDDTMVVGGQTGAFLVLNSWGDGWGKGGWGWMPYSWMALPDGLFKPFDLWAVHAAS